jgi:hypothetical protein
MTCLGINRVIKTAPIAATEIIIGFLTLHLHFEAETKAGSMETQI